MTTRAHHPPCAGGCGQLADECGCRRPNPLGSMTIDHGRRDAAVRVRRLRTRQGIMFQPVCDCGAKMQAAWSRSEAEQAASDHAFSQNTTPGARHHIVEMALR